MRKLVIIASISAIAMIGASGTAMASPPPVNSGNVHSTVTVADTISMTGVGNSVPFGTGSPLDVLDVPAALTPVISVNHHGGATLNEVPQNGGFKYSAGTGDVIPDNAVSIDGIHLADGNPTALKVIASGTSAQQYPEDWKLTIPATPGPGTTYDATTPLFADFALQLIAN
jgi:hypothetical protein